ncbi:lipid-transfer protein [Acrocarpospora macrocephala]|uniref:Lipid-transfer protein n=1 Tax=Acrocarpospora macrocephala TaxID=150177 RepID=A0A5M3X3S2_9ACTN|nr:lipid-transfer protein [Acrocarpospora macrocephala]
MPDQRIAIVGVGQTTIWPRGQSAPLTEVDLTCRALMSACDDAGIAVTDVDGFAFYRGGVDAGLLAQTLGIDEITFCASLSGAGGGSAGSLGLAAAAIQSGMATVVACPMAFQQIGTRFGAAYARDGVGGGPLYNHASPEDDYLRPADLVAPAQMFGLIAQRHMHKYGTTREAFAEVAITFRDNARKTPGSLMTKPMTREDYFNARMISDPICLFDCCVESEGAGVVLVTSLERARDLRKTPVEVLASVHGGEGDWGQGIMWLNMPDEIFSSSGHRGIAKRMYERAGIKPADVDVAMIYDHFAPMVLLQLEDYGFCAIGESNDFVLDGNIRMDGAIPVNPNGGQLSNGYLIGFSLVTEAVRQVRGEGANQVAGAEVALVTGGPAALPVSGSLLRAVR